MGTPYTVADYLIARLTELGIRHLFQVPGDYCGPFLEAVEASDTLLAVGNQVELGSGYAADGYARLAGVGATCVQWGVGTFSVLNCTAGSYVERVPVVVISASPTHADRRLERLRGVLFHHSTGDLRADQRVFDNVTVASVVVKSAKKAPRQIDDALTAMLTHRRPVYIEVLNDVWSTRCAKPRGELAAEPLRSDAADLAAMLDATMERLESSLNPLFLLGVQLARFGLQDTAQALVSASGLPFVTTSLSKTVLDESQAAFVGTYAGPASMAVTRAQVAEADCILTLGALITDDYLDLANDRYGQMVLCTDEDARVGFGHYQKVSLPDFVEGLLARIQASPEYPRSTPFPPHPQLPAPPDGAEQLTYNLFFDTLAGWLLDGRADDATVILGESTSLYVWGNLFGLPRDGFVANAAWGSLGHETGAALGTWLASGKRPYVVAGDGGFRMVCQELASMAHARCPAVVFVMENDVYAIEQAFVDITAFQTGDFAAFDVLPSFDYLALGKAFRADARLARTVGELTEVLAGLSDITDRPVLVACAIPDTDLAPQLARLAGSV